MYSINGDRIDLREISIDDTDNILLWRNLKTVRENFIFQELLTKETHIHWLNTYINTQKAIQFIIHENSTNNDIGTVYLRDIDKINKKAEFGIYIGNTFSADKGLGSEATLMILNYGFSELNLHKITLRVLSTNEKAIHVYKKCGFDLVGIFKDDVIINDVYKDVIFMEIVNK